MAKRRVKTIEKPQKAKEEQVKKIKIRVIGIGGGGGNIVSEISQRIKGKAVSFIAANTDLKSLKALPRSIGKFQFGQNLTNGLGTGMNAEIGEAAAKSEKEKIKKLLEGCDLVILVASLGGGAGSGASPVFAQISRGLGNLTYGIFTLPFKFEGERKIEIAQNALGRLRKNLNAFSLLLNERIFQVIDRDTPLKKALSVVNKNLANIFQSLLEIIYKPGLINIDFADFKTIFEGWGKLTYLNLLELEKNDAKESLGNLLESPLYSYGIEGAKAVLFNIAGQKDLSLAEVSQISKVISERVDKEAKIVFGVSQTKAGEKIKLTLLAMGCAKPRGGFDLTGVRKNLPEKTKIISEPKPPERKKITLRKLPSKKNKLPPVSAQPQLELNPGSDISKTLTKKQNEIIIRKNALELKKEVEAEETEMLEKEKFWESPSFLKKIN